MLKLAVAVMPCLSAGSPRMACGTVMPMWQCAVAWVGNPTVCVLRGTAQDDQRRQRLGSKNKDEHPEEELRGHHQSEQKESTL